MDEKKTPCESLITTFKAQFKNKVNKAPQPKEPIESRNCRIFMDSV
jgi:hypothetical protein